MKSSGKGSVLLRAMYGVKETMIFICSILVSVFAGSPSPLVDLSISNLKMYYLASARELTRINGNVSKLIREVG